MANISGNNKGNNLKGTNGKDTIKGKGGNDTIKGKDGDDKLYDGNGNDHVYGGKGNDKFFAGLGSDDMYGGAGKDKFIYKGGALGDDRIHGLERGDRIVIDKSYGFNSVQEILDNVRSSGGSLTIDLSRDDEGFGAGLEGYQIHLIEFDNMNQLEDIIVLA